MGVTLRVHARVLVVHGVAPQRHPVLGAHGLHRLEERDHALDGPEVAGLVVVEDEEVQPGRPRQGVVPPRRLLGGDARVVEEGRVAVHEPAVLRPPHHRPPVAVDQPVLLPRVPARPRPAPGIGLLRVVHPHPARVVPVPRVQLLQDQHCSVREVLHELKRVPLVARGPVEPTRPVLEVPEVDSEVRTVRRLQQPAHGVHALVLQPRQRRRVSAQTGEVGRAPRPRAHVARALHHDVVHAHGLHERELVQPALLVQLEHELGPARDEHRVEEGRRRAAALLARQELPRPGPPRPLRARPPGGEAQQQGQQQGQRGWQPEGCPHGRAVAVRFPLGEPPANRRTPEEWGAFWMRKRFEGSSPARPPPPRSGGEKALGGPSRRRPRRYRVGGDRRGLVIAR